MYKIENIYPDRSEIGAKLGQHVKEVIRPGDVLVLDDHDFTTFLFYSDNAMVYTISKDGGKPWEWWTLKYSDWNGFVTDHKEVLLVTPNRNLFSDQTNGGKVVESYLGYNFLQFN